MINLDIAAKALRDLHKALINYQAMVVAFEGSSLQLYEQVTKDPKFLWLRPMTALITELDELKSGDAEVSASERLKYQRQITNLITEEGVKTRLHSALQVSPDVGLALGALRAALS